MQLTIAIIFYNVDHIEFLHKLLNDPGVLDQADFTQLILRKLELITAIKMPAKIWMAGSAIWLFSNSFDETKTD